MKKWGIALLLCLLMTSIFAQSFSDRFWNRFNDNDISSLPDILNAWADSSKDAEYFVCAYNYWLTKSRDQQLIISKSLSPRAEDYLILTPADSSELKSGGFLYYETDYEPFGLATAFEVISEGIQAYPYRLDLRFGKIHMLGEVGDFQQFTSTIIEAIDFGFTHNHQWLWSENQPQPDARAFFLTAMQDYQHTIYDTYDDSLLPYMTQIADRILKYDPNHVESLTNKAIVLMIGQQLNEALPLLLKAHGIDATDTIVLGNLAFLHSQLGDKRAAISYYEKIVALSSGDDAEFARQQIELLNTEKKD